MASLKEGLGIYFREKTGDGYSPGSPGLANSGLSLTYIGVGGNGQIYQGIKGGVLKGAPPVYQSYGCSDRFAGLFRGNNLLSIPG